MEFVGGTGAVMHPISMPGFLEIYKVDRTFKALTPDDVDPKRTKPNVPWAWAITDDAGSANPIIARVFIQCAEALKDKKLTRGDSENIKISLHTAKEDLRKCEKAFLKVAAAQNAIVEEIQKTGGLKIERRVVNNLPQVAHLEDEATVFLINAKRAVQNIAEVLNDFFGITIKNGNFSIGIKQLRALQPSPDELLKVLDIFEPKIKRIVDMRNSQEHMPKKTFVENFRLTADAILPPSWRINPEPDAEILPEMHSMIGEIIELAECCFFHGLIQNLEPFGPFQYVVEEIPLEHRNGTALLLRCELQFANPS